MQWVKTTERNPSVPGDYFVRTSLVSHDVATWEYDSLLHKMDWDGDLRGTEEDPEIVLEWLEEN